MSAKRRAPTAPSPYALRLAVGIFYQEILAGQRPTMDTQLELRSIKVFVRSISEPKAVSLTSSAFVCKSDVGRTDIQRIGPELSTQMLLFQLQRNPKQFCD